MRTHTSALSALAALLVVAPATAQPVPAEPAPTPASPEAPAGPPADAAPSTDGDDGPPGAEPAASESSAEASEPAAVHPPVAPGQALPPGHPPVDEAAQLPPPPLPPPPLFPSDFASEEPELVGFQGGRFFLRDAEDVVRLYPGGRLRTDFGYMPGSPDLPVERQGNLVGPGFSVRRVRLELSGEIYRRLYFTLGAELGGQRIGEVSYVGDGTPRFAPANAHDGVIRPAEVSVSYRLRDWLGLTAGSHNLPFSMENRTREFATTFFERNIAIRGFAVPYAKDLGLSAWGEIFDERMLNYEVGLYGGDGPQRPFADANPDVVGRVWSRPLAGLGDGVFWDLTQIGISARHGQRDPDFVGYDLANVASNQGFVFWQPGYLDAQGRVTRVLPSGAENAIGGELRTAIQAPTGAVFELRGEGYFVSRQTREAIQGFETTNTERFGRLRGASFYAELSFWGCCTDQLVTGEPGVYRPYSIDPGRDIPNKRGLEVSVLGAGIAANYDGATREGSLPDANTPTKNIVVWQAGGGIQYWWNWNFRAGLNYFAYIVPEAGDATRNQAIVPDNLPHRSGLVGTRSVHHELAARLALTF